MVSASVQTHYPYLQEMVADLEELCDNHFGRRVLLYLLSPRNPQHFSSQFISILSPGDANPHRLFIRECGGILYLGIAMQFLPL